MPLAPVRSFRSASGHQQTVILSMLGVILLVAVDKVGSKKVPAPADFIAPAFLAVVLSFLSGPAPEVASGFAILVLLAVLFSRGPRVLRRFGFGEPAKVVPIRHGGRNAR